MSPEQVMGSRAVVDHRADIYSLGATLYELITLRPAFDCVDRLELIVKIAHEDPRRPRQIDPAIPRDLETIVLKAMAKDPMARYATAAALADDLGRFLDRRPIVARRPNAIDRAAKWSRRHRPAVMAAALVLILTMIGFGADLLWRDGVIRHHNIALRTALVDAERNESSARRLLYDSQIGLAHQAWASGHVEVAQELLEKSRPEPAKHDLRGFEWNHLRRACECDISMLARHETPITAMALAPDGRTLVSADFDGVMIFWDIAGSRERARVQGHAGQVPSLAFSPDGLTLVSCSFDPGKPGEFKFWDAVTARERVRIPVIMGNVSGWAFSLDSRVLAISERLLMSGPPISRSSFWKVDRDPGPARRGTPAE